MEENIFFHPPLSSIPWAFILIATIVELTSLVFRKKGLGLQEFSRQLSLIAAIGSIIAFMSGLLASNSMPDAVSEVLADHFEFGRLTMFACIGVGALATLLPVAERSVQSKLRWVFRFCLIGTVILIAFTGHEGNELREARIKDSIGKLKSSEPASDSQLNPDPVEAPDKL